MSSIYIPNMEMPKEGQEILISAGITGTVYARLTPSEEDARVEKDCWHKVIPIPNHGRCIDEDALWVEINKICDRRDAEIISDLTCINQILSAIRHAPTIIPADHAEK